jgi:hypothetical protein
MPRVDVIQVPAVAELGVALEGSDRPAGRDSALLAFDAHLGRARTIQLFNRGSVPFDYTVEAGAPWLLVRSPRGQLREQADVVLEVDWSRAPAGEHRVPVTVAGGGRRVVVTAVVDNTAREGGGFLESGGVVAMEAEHFTRAVAAGPVRWVRVPELGRTLSAMTPQPATAPSQNPGAGPRLEYRVNLARAGEVSVHAYLSPSLDFRGGEGLRYAVSIDDEPPQVVNIHADGSSRAGDSNRAWEQSVANNIKVTVSRHRVSSPGEHTVKFWMIEPGVVLQRLVVDAGGLQPSYLGPPESARRP